MRSAQPHRTSNAGILLWLKVLHVSKNTETETDWVWNRSVPKTRYTKTGSHLTSSLLFFPFLFYLNGKLIISRTSGPCRVTGAGLVSVNILNHMAWDKAQQTHKATHSDKTDVTWSLSNGCFLDLWNRNASVSNFSFSGCLDCVWLPFPEVDSNFQTRS